ncbi:hypothetical protein ACNKHL_16635 [Shigella flexneri]
MLVPRECRLAPSISKICFALSRIGVAMVPPMPAFLDHCRNGR